MLRRLTDTIVCGVLMIFDVLAWLIVGTFSGFDRSEPGKIASVSLSALIIVAVPALATCMIAALARMITKTSARCFYAWALFLSAVAGGFCYLSAMVSSFQGMEVGLRWMACYFAIQAIVSLVLLLVGLTGGIPRTAEDAHALNQAALKRASSTAKPSPAEASAPTARTSASAVPPVPSASSKPQPAPRANAEEASSEEKKERL